MGSLGGTIGGLAGSVLGPVGGLIGGGLGSLAGAAIGGNRNEAMPSMQHADLNPETQNLYNQRISSAMESPEAASRHLANASMNNVGSAGALLQGGGVSSPMQSAIQKRQQQMFGDSTNNLYRTQVAQGPVNQFNNLAGTIGAANKEAADAQRFAQQQLQAQENQQVARNNAINSVLGNLGTVGGAILGKDQASAQLGQGVGNSFGLPGGNLYSIGGGL